MRRAGGRRRISLSLANRLALVFSAITLGALALLYLYVAPGLQTRLLKDQLAHLASDSRVHSKAIAGTVGNSVPLATVQNHVNAAALATGDRVRAGPGPARLASRAARKTRGGSRRYATRSGWRRSCAS